MYSSALYVPEISVPPSRQRVLDPVICWNEVALEAATIDSTRPEFVVVDGGRFFNRDQGGVTRTSRALAMVHIAMYNAVAGLQNKPSFFVQNPDLPAETGRDISVAVGAAAYYLLRLLYPRQRSVMIRTTDGKVIFQDFQSHLQQAYLHVQKRVISFPQLKQSETFGYNVAVRVFNSRREDGSTARVRYSGQLQPGVWRADLLDPEQLPLDPHWGTVKPFILSASEIADVFDSVPPPKGYRGSDCHSDRYDLNDNSYQQERQKVRDTVDQLSAQDKLNAIFWVYDEGRGTPARLYNKAVRSVLLSQKYDGKLSTYELARFLLYANLVMADAAIAGWRIKYCYRLWRPVHAVRLDPKASPSDRLWEPYGKVLPYASAIHCSPPFPAYISGHSIIGTALFKALTRFTNTDSFRFSLTSNELPRLTGEFQSFKQAYDLNNISRVQLGVHFPQDVEEGAAAGIRLENSASDRFDKGMFQPGDAIRELPPVPVGFDDPRTQIDFNFENLPGFGDQVAIDDGSGLKEV